MSKEEVIEIVKQIGYDKGYENPEDFYKGITQDELNKKISNYTKHINGYFTTINNTIRACFPNYSFLEWKFNRVSFRFWNNINNQITYLKWLEVEVWGESGNPLNWYNLNLDILNKNNGAYFIKTTLINTPKILYPNYKFETTKFNRSISNRWNKWEILEQFLTPIVKQIGRMLVTCEIKKYTNGLYYGIQKHGGIKKVAEKLGVQSPIVFKTINGELVKSTYEVIVANFLYLNNITFDYENKIIDSELYLYDFKIGDIFMEVWGFVRTNSGGDIYKKRRKLKEKLYEKYKLTLCSIERDLFQNLNLKKINDELIRLMKLYNIKNDNFYQGDLNEFIKFYSYNKDIIFKEIKDECEKLNIKKFPIKNWWINNGFGRQMSYLTRNKIKHEELLKYLNLDDSCYFDNKPQGYWRSFDNLKKEILIICETKKCFPTTTVLKKLNRFDIIHAIILYHGGIYSVREKINYDNFKGKKRKAHWKNFDNIKYELLKIYKEIKIFPNITILLNLKRSDLINAMQKYHGGFDSVRQILGFNDSETKKPNGYWFDWNNLSKELLSLCYYFGHFPTNNELISLDRTDIIGGMRNHGNIADIRKKLNFIDTNPLPYKMKGYWLDFNNIIKELNPILKLLGHFPTQDELYGLKRGDIVSAMKENYGGIVAVKNIFIEKKFKW
jgi:hypothetical protein